VDLRTLELFRLLSSALLWGAAAVIVLAVIGAIAIASSQNELGLLAENVEREGRAVAAIAALAGGITGAGILAGLGAILRLLLAREEGDGGAARTGGDAPGQDE